jgi:hypothetical protein
LAKRRSAAVWTSFCGRVQRPRGRAAPARGGSAGGRAGQHRGRSNTHLVLTARRLAHAEPLLVLLEALHQLGEEGHRGCVGLLLAQHRVVHEALQRKEAHEVRDALHRRLGRGELVELGRAVEEGADEGPEGGGRGVHQRFGMAGKSDEQHLKELADSRDHRLTNRAGLLSKRLKAGKQVVKRVISFWEVSAACGCAGGCAWRFPPETRLGAVGPACLVGAESVAVPCAVRPRGVCVRCVVVPWCS